MSFIEVENISKRYKISKRKGVTAVMLTGILILSVAFLADASYNPFLYFRF